MRTSVETQESQESKTREEVKQEAARRREETRLCQVRAHLSLLCLVPLLLLRLTTRRCRRRRRLVPLRHLDVPIVVDVDVVEAELLVLEVGALVVLLRERGVRVGGVLCARCGREA